MDRTGAALPRDVLRFACQARERVPGADVYWRRSCNRQRSSATNRSRTSWSSAGAFSSAARTAVLSSRVRPTIFARNKRAVSSFPRSDLSTVAASFRTSRSSIGTPPTNIPCPLGRRSEIPASPNRQRYSPPRPTDKVPNTLAALEPRALRARRRSGRSPHPGGGRYSTPGAAAIGRLRDPIASRQHSRWDPRIPNPSPPRSKAWPNLRAAKGCVPKPNSPQTSGLLRPTSRTLRRSRLRLVPRRTRNCRRVPGGGRTRRRAQGAVNDDGGFAFVGVGVVAAAGDPAVCRARRYNNRIRRSRALPPFSQVEAKPAGVRRAGRRFRPHLERRVGFGHVTLEVVKRGPLVAPSRFSAYGWTSASAKSSGNTGNSRATVSAISRLRRSIARQKIASSQVERRATEGAQTRLNRSRAPGGVGCCELALH